VPSSAGNLSHDALMDPQRIAQMSRRELIAAISAVGAAAALGLPETVASAAPAASRRDLDTVRRAASVKPHGGDLGAVEHVVFLMMENRSYDHYFGAYPKGRGFDDHGKHHLGHFAQHYPDGTKLHPKHTLLPFHLSPAHGEDCTNDLTHNWGPQHDCWNHGKMNHFVTTHTASKNEGNPDGAMTMGYYTRRDIPFYWSLADHFTLLDNYHCSVLGPTHPNRLMSISGTIDPAGKHGGPITDTSADPSKKGSLDWTTMPEVLQDAGLSWKVYHPNDQNLVNKGYFTWNGSMYDPDVNPSVLFTTDHILPYFKQYQLPGTALHTNAFTPEFPRDLANDVKQGTLPHVSWIIPPLGFDDHPSASPRQGQYFVRRVVETLMANRKTWSKTVLFLMYDENDGWFDHVRPPVSPPRTAGEHLTAKTIPSDTEGIRHPIGLGFRVPGLMISPFSRGGHISSELCDHTSQLKLLHARWGVEIPNVSKWRREKVHDLTHALFHHRTDASKPKLHGAPLPPMNQGQTCAEQEFEQGGAHPSIPVHQRMPTQHGTTQPASRYFPHDGGKPKSRERINATSGRNTATVKSSANPLAHGGKLRNAADS
jgi:phospholipase C